MTTKFLVSTLFLLLCPYYLYAQTQDTITLNPQLTKVTLYYNTSQLTMSAPLALSAGEYVLYLLNIPDLPSLQFSYVEGMKIMRSENVSYQAIQHKYNANSNASDIQKNKLRRQLDSISLVKQTYSNARQVAYDQVMSRWTMTPTNTLNSSIFEESYKAIDNFTTETKRQEAVFDQQKNKIQQDIDKIANSKASNLTITNVLALTVSCKKTIADTLHIEYIDKQGEWQPTYEAHVANTQKAVNLQLFAKIKQNSPSDWKNVQLVLINRAYGDTHPVHETNVFKPVVVSIHSRNNGETIGEPPIFAPTMHWVKGRSDRSCLNEDPEKCKVWALDTTYQLQKTFVESRRILEKKFDIKSYTNIRYPLAQADTIPTRYEFWANSRLNNDVFLTAYLQKWQQYDLPSGNVDVYFDGFWVAQTTFKPNTTATEIPLQIGKVDGVYVERTSFADNYIQIDASGGTHAVKCSYKIRIMNNRQQAIQLLLRDRIPVSSAAEVTVEPITLSGAEYTSDTGFLTWNIPAQPKVPMTLAVEYKINYPKGAILKIGE
ncbi:MAG: DUF4139 domain-containing protein [Chitinophagales bacterium]|nr:DUF4139 domain-containing protein [Chitinophagales bacterium]